MIKALKTPAFAAVLSKLFSAGLSFVFLWLVAYFLDVRDAGIFLYTYMVMMIIVQISRAGTEHSIIPSLVDAKSSSFIFRLFSRYACYVGCYALFILLVICVLVAVGAISVYSTQDDYISLGLLLAVSILFLYLQVFSSIFQIKQMIYSYYWCLAIAVSFSGVISVVACVLIFDKLDHVDLSIFFTFFVVLSFLSGFYLFQKLISREYSANPPMPDHLSLSVIAKEAFPFSVIAFISVMSQWGAQLFSGVWLSEESLAIVSVISRIGMLVGFLYLAFISMLTPKISALYQRGDIQSVVKVSEPYLVVSNIYSITLFLFFLVCGEAFLGLFGDEYVAGYEALLLISLAYVLQSFSGPTSALLLMTGHQKVIRNNLLVSLVILIGLSPLLIPTYDVLGVAIIAAVTLGVVSLLNLLAVYRYFGILFLLDIDYFGAIKSIRGRFTSGRASV